MDSLIECRRASGLTSAHPPKNAGVSMEKVRTHSGAVSVDAGRWQAESAYAKNKCCENPQTRGNLSFSWKVNNACTNAVIELISNKSIVWNSLIIGTRWFNQQICKFSRCQMDFEPFYRRMWWWSDCGWLFGSSETIQSCLLSLDSEDAQPVSPSANALSGDSALPAAIGIHQLLLLVALPVQTFVCAHLAATTMLLEFKMDVIDQGWDAATAFRWADWGHSINFACNMKPSNIKLYNKFVLWPNRGDYLAFIRK